MIETSLHSSCRKPTKPHWSICSTFVERFWTWQQICEHEWHRPLCWEPGWGQVKCSPSTQILLESFPFPSHAFHAGDNSEVAQAGTPSTEEVCVKSTVSTSSLSIFMNEKGKSGGEAKPCHNCYHAVCPFPPKHCGSVLVSCKGNCFYVVNQPETWFLIWLIFNSTALGLTSCPAFSRAVWERLEPLISDLCV